MKQPPAQVPRSGISQVRVKDFRVARSIGVGGSQHLVSFTLTRRLGDSSFVDSSKASRPQGSKAIAASLLTQQFLCKMSESDSLPKNLEQGFISQTSKMLTISDASNRHSNLYIYIIYIYIYIYIHILNYIICVYIYIYIYVYVYVYVYVCIYIYIEI